MNLLRALQEAGYAVDDIPPDGDALMHRLIDRCTNDEEFLTDDQLRNAVGHVSLATYDAWFNELPAPARRAMVEQWGIPLGEVGRIDDRLAIPGLIFGNVFVGIQPPRGFGADPMAIYHSPDLPPTHHYLAYYRWLRDEFGAHAVLHMGKHGNLEWLPGKATALSSASATPRSCSATCPTSIPTSSTTPARAPRPSGARHAVIIDHLIPPMTQAETYDDLARLEQLLDEYYRMASLDPVKLPYHHAADLVARHQEQPRPRPEGRALPRGRRSSTRSSRRSTAICASWGCADPRWAAHLRRAAAGRAARRT